MPTAVPETVIRLAGLSRAAPAEVALEPDGALLAQLKADLGLGALRKVRLRGRLAPVGRRDWHLTATLGATVVQPCSITLEPVTTRIDEAIERSYLAAWTPPAETEAEMPEDDTTEPLPETLDLREVLSEALALALPAFPRAQGAELGDLAAAPPGAAPLDSPEAGPFAGLEGLKRKLDG